MSDTTPPLGELTGRDTPVREADRGAQYASMERAAAPVAGVQTSEDADIPAGILKTTQRELRRLTDRLRGDAARTSDPRLRARLEISTAVLLGLSRTFADQR